MGIYIIDGKSKPNTLTIKLTRGVHKNAKNKGKTIEVF